LTLVERLEFLFTIVGAPLTLIALVITIVQITKTKNAARKAVEATNNTQDMLKKNISMSELSICIGMADTVKVYLENTRYDAASVKMKDFLQKIVDLRHSYNSSDRIINQKFQDIIARTKVINVNLGEKAINNEARFNEKKTKIELTEISLILQNLVGANKYQISIGEKNDTRRI